MNNYAEGKLHDWKPVTVDEIHITIDVYVKWKQPPVLSAVTQAK
jgi:hypothetical protein